MKSIVFALLFITSLCQGQDTLTYFNERWEKVCCKDSAHFYRIGKYDHGIYDGDITDYFMSGKVQMTGAYLNWVQNGLYKWYYRNGKKMATGNYINGDFVIINGWDSLGNKTVKAGEGYFKWHHTYNGMVSSEGKYQAGRKVGKWILYNINGVKIEELDYTADGLTVLNAWDESGLIQLVVNGNGEYSGYYKNGKLKFKGSYVVGKKEGNWVWYFANGNLDLKATFSRGYWNGINYYYYDNGILRKEITFDKGRANGPVKFYHVNGKLSCSGFLTMDKQSNLWQWYNKEGMATQSHDYGEVFEE